MNRRLAHPRFELAPISSFEAMLQYGCSKRATEEPVGYRMLRMNNLQNDGWHLDDLKHVVLSESEFSTWRLEPGDIVFNRTNSKELVGKCEVFDEPGDWVFASYLMRLRVHRNRALPEFVTAFLNTRAGRVQIDRESRQIIGMSNINAEEIRTLRVPLPKSTTRQRELLMPLDAARTRRKRMGADADALLGGLDAFVLDQLCLTLPPPDDRDVYATRLRDGVRLRIDANFHTPRFRKLQRGLEQIKAEPLGTLMTPSQMRADPSLGDGTHFRYIEISSVNAGTGEATTVDTPRSEAPSRARMIVHDGDIIVSLTRPQRGSIALIDASLDGCIASTGFAVLRNISRERVQACYLWAFLRTQAARMQMLQRSSGGNYPAITEDELTRILVPVPHAKVQSEIATEVARRRVEARRLRHEAESLWEQAKGAFEAALLGPMD